MIGLIQFLFHVYFFMGTVGSIDTELRLVQLIFRHGDRTPINMFPGVTQNETIWDKYGGLGQLTQKGMKEMLNFGEFFRLSE